MFSNGKTMFFEKTFEKPKYINANMKVCFEKECIWSNENTSRTKSCGYCLGFDLNGFKNKQIFEFTF